ncbi:unnamed protein product [Lota lota]
MAAVEPVRPGESGLWIGAKAGPPQKTLGLTRPRRALAEGAAGFLSGALDGTSINPNAPPSARATLPPHLATCHLQRTSLLITLTWRVTSEAPVSRQQL